MKSISLEWGQRRFKFPPHCTVKGTPGQVTQSLSAFVFSSEKKLSNSTHSIWFLKVKKLDHIQQVIVI